MKKNRLKLWHQRIGLSAAIFVLLLAISGILLNHTHELQLDNRHISSSVLLSIYGMELPDNPTCFPTSLLPVCQLGENTYIGTQSITADKNSLLGAHVSEEMYLLLYKNSLSLFTKDSRLIEKIPLPQAADLLAITPDQYIAIKTDTQWQMSDLSFFTWEPVRNENSLTMITPENPAAGHVQKLQAQSADDLLSWERLLLDLHSGRIFGSWGVYLMDLCALALVLLAGSGIYRWSTKKQQ